MLRTPPLPLHPWLLPLLLLCAAAAAAAAAPILLLLVRTPGHGALLMVGQARVAVARWAAPACCPSTARCSMMMVGWGAALSPLRALAPRQCWLWVLCKRGAEWTSFRIGRRCSIRASWSAGGGQCVATRAAHHTPSRRQQRAGGGAAAGPTTTHSVRAAPAA